MRVLSFIPAFLLAAASFVAAAPSSPVDSSVVARSGNDSPVQDLISVLSDATNNITAEVALLGGAPTADTVDNVLTAVASSINAVIAEVQATAGELAGIDPTGLETAITAFLDAVSELLSALVLALTVNGLLGIASVQAALSALVNAILSLTTILNINIVSSILPFTVLALLDTIANTLLLIL